MASPRVLLEICVESVADAVAAAEAGAGRIELCSALSLGGLTPSHGLVAEVVQRVDVPVMVMIRPRESGFRYSDVEFETMCRDAAFAVEARAEGVVFGILHSDGSVDAARCARLAELAGERQTVFHRAFDVVPDPFAALETLIDLGFTRVLTSGGQPTAVEGAEIIRQLIDLAGGRIELLPGGGLNEDNLVDFVRSTGCRQVHMGLATERIDPSISDMSQIQFASPVRKSERCYRSLDLERLQSAMKSLAR